MGLRLVRGAPGSGKTALVFDEFRRALADCAQSPSLQRPRIVVPTATLVRHFQHELARDGVVCSPDSVVSFSRYARELVPDVKLAPPGLIKAIIHTTLVELSLPEFADVAATAGMAAVVAETVSLFENAGATPAKLAGVRKLHPRARAFERVWRNAAEKIRASGYATRAEMIRAAVSRAEPGARLWLDGFLAFSPLESELVGAMANNCDLTLTLADSPATDDLRRFALRHAAGDRLLPAGVVRRPRMKLVEAVSPEREADDIARRILELRTTCAFRDIAVALRDDDVYLPLLRTTFQRFGIPARFYFAAPLRRHPIAIFLGGIIACALNGWDFQTAIETLRAHPCWGRTADMDRLDFALREAMPGHGPEAILALCPEGRFKDGIAECLAPARWRDRQAIPADWQHRLEALAANLYRPGLVAEPADHANALAARGHIAALRSWLDAIDTAGALFPNPDQPVSLSEFWRGASEVVDSGVVDTPDQRADVVHVMSAYEARQWDVKALFVCGMTDREYPRRHPQNLLFPDADINTLISAGIPLRAPSDLDREERFLFQSLRSRATETLVLSYPRHDSGGRTVERSRFFTAGDTAIDSAALELETARLVRPSPTRQPELMGIAGQIAAPELLQAVAQQHRSISVTALEDLSQCRFRFFSGRTLGLKPPPETPGERLQPRVTGLILHEALEHWQVDKNRDFVELFEEAFEAARRKLHLPAGYRLEVERIQFGRIARRVKANERWNADSSDPEVALALEFPGGITVNCRIDRIDRFGEDCVIVDYKSSKTQNVEKLVASRTKLQGPLYSLAVREQLGLNPVAMLYWAVREDKLVGWGHVPGTEIPLNDMPPNWAIDGRTRAVERIESFLAGAVHAHPEEKDQCRWCDFASACRVEQERQTRVMIEGASR